MGECDVPPTPDNFELFYIHASGENATLSLVVGDMIGQHLAFTPKVLAELRARALSRERAAKAMDDVGSGINEMLDAVLDKLEAAGKHAGDYGRTLS